MIGTPHGLEAVSSILDPTLVRRVLEVVVKRIDRLRERLAVLCPVRVERRGDGRVFLVTIGEQQFRACLLRGRSSEAQRQVSDLVMSPDGSKGLLRVKEADGWKLYQLDKI